MRSAAAGKLSTAAACGVLPNRFSIADDPDEEPQSIKSRRFCALCFALHPSPTSYIATSALFNHFKLHKSNIIKWAALTIE